MNLFHENHNQIVVFMEEASKDLFQGKRRASTQFSLAQLLLGKLGGKHINLFYDK